jgi:hypothetical protein
MLNNVSISNMKLISDGFDHTSFFGSNIEYNNEHIIVSANGYDIFSGIVIIYKNDINSTQFYKA